jgi:hypothetical protein
MVSSLITKKAKARNQLEIDEETGLKTTIEKNKTGNSKITNNSNEPSRTLESKADNSVGMLFVVVSMLLSSTSSPLWYNSVSSFISFIHLQLLQLYSKSLLMACVLYFDTDNDVSHNIKNHGEWQTRAPVLQ